MCCEWSNSNASASAEFGERKTAGALLSSGWSQSQSSKRPCTFVANQRVNFQSNLPDVRWGAGAFDKDSFRLMQCAAQISSKFSYLTHGMTLGGPTRTIGYRQYTDTLRILGTKAGVRAIWCIQTTTWQVIAQRYFGSDLQPFWRRYGRAVRALEAAEQQAESRWQQAQAWPSNKEFGFRFHHSVQCQFLWCLRILL